MGSRKIENPFRAWIDGPLQGPGHAYSQLWVSENQNLPHVRIQAILLCASLSPKSPDSACGFLMAWGSGLLWFYIQITNPQWTIFSSKFDIISQRCLSFPHSHCYKGRKKRNGSYLLMLATFPRKACTSEALSWQPQHVSVIPETAESRSYWWCLPITDLHLSAAGWLSGSRCWVMCHH